MFVGCPPNVFLFSFSKWLANYYESLTSSLIKLTIVLVSMIVRKFLVSGGGTESNSNYSQWKIYNRSMDDVDSQQQLLDSYSKLIEGKFMIFTCNYNASKLTVHFAQVNRINNLQIFTIILNCRRKQIWILTHLYNYLLQNDLQLSKKAYIIIILMIIILK